MERVPGLGVGVRSAVTVFMLMTRTMSVFGIKDVRDRGEREEGEEGGSHTHAVHAAERFKRDLRRQK